jgi:hypothetical protein
LLRYKSGVSSNVSKIKSVRITSLEAGKKMGNALLYNVSGMWLKRVCKIPKTTARGNPFS